MFPDTGFSDIYTELYIQSEEKKLDEDTGEEEEFEQQNQIINQQLPKKRGRKPKSFNIQKILDE